ncbi:MAG: cytochrome c oxidase subunit 3 family protein [Candidatus Dadabacteria bacterium]|nr:MAG: cytochrome c oxidase subunit 3 family protein [Candidatus Dadabacteria bacterium]
MSTQCADSLCGEPPKLHHMDSDTAYHAAKFGMWLFLATEILLFGGLFCAFALYRWMYLEEFSRASEELNVWLGGTNTIVLIVSSFFVALAVDAAQKGNNKKVSSYLLYTILCAATFLVIKYFEYSAKYHHGLFPANPEFNSPDFNKAYRSFFGLYYCMTGLHAIHVMAGMVILLWIRAKAKAGRFSEKYYTPVEVGALYWHLVDLIWIYLFPLLYLVG